MWLIQSGLLTDWGACSEKPRRFGPIKIVAGIGSSISGPYQIFDEGKFGTLINSLQPNS